MSDPYRKVKAGRLTFKGGDLATTDKKKKKRKHNKASAAADEAAVDFVAVAAGDEEGSAAAAAAGEEGGGGGGGEGDIYTIDAAKKMKYEELFPVETKRFGYDPANKSRASKSVEDALDDRVKKKADRYCK